MYDTLQVKCFVCNNWISKQPETMVSITVKESRIISRIKLNPSNKLKVINNYFSQGLENNNLCNDATPGSPDRSQHSSYHLQAAVRQALRRDRKPKTRPCFAGTHRQTFSRSRRTEAELPGLSKCCGNSGTETAGKPEAERCGPTGLHGNGHLGALLRLGQPIWGGPAERPTGPTRVPG